MGNNIENSVVSFVSFFFEIASFFFLKALHGFFFESSSFFFETSCSSREKYVCVNFNVSSRHLYKKKPLSQIFLRIIQNWFLCSFFLYKE